MTGEKEKKDWQTNRDSESAPFVPFKLRSAKELRREVFDPDDSSNTVDVRPRYSDKKELFAAFFSFSFIFATALSYALFGGVQSQGELVKSARRSNSNNDKGILFQSERAANSVETIKETSNDKRVSPLFQGGLEELQDQGSAVPPPKEKIQKQGFISKSTNDIFLRREIVFLVNRMRKKSRKNPN